MLAYYLDEDTADRDLIRAMRRRGIDVASPAEAGMLHREDAEHLAYATQHDRVLYSFNVRDYCRLHSDWTRLGKSHAGITLAHQWRRYSIGTQLRGLLRLASQKSATQMRDRLEYGSPQ